MLLASPLLTIQLIVDILEASSLYGMKERQRRASNEKKLHFNLQLNQIDGENEQKMRKRMLKIRQNSKIRIVDFERTFTSDIGGRS